MMTSGEISQMFAAQNQAFMGQQQFAQQIGVMAPNPTLSGWGTPQMGATQGFPGMRAPPPAFNYNPGAWGGGGYGGGTRFAGGAMSALGGAASFGGAALGVASMFGKMGAIAPLVDPFAGAAAGFGAAGIGGALAGAAVPLALAYGAGKVANTFIGGAQNQQMIQSQLGSYNFYNPASRTGTGFTRDDALAIGQSVRSLAHVPEMLTSVEELTKLMPKMKSMGVMQGVRDAAEFAHRFKETVHTIRDVSKLLGTTMEEAADFFAASRGVGFMGRQAQIQNVLNTQFTSGFTGMSMGQTMQLQQAGAQMARQVGGRGAQGATAVMNIAQRLEQARQRGGVTEEMIQDVAGVGGAEGVAGASQRMYELMLNMRQSAPGRLIMAGAMKRDANGRVVLDQDVIEKLNRGEIGIDELKSRAGRLSNEDKISFTQRAGGTLGSQFAGSVDVGRFMQGLVGGKGRDAAALMLGRYTGGNEQDIDMLMQLGQGPSFDERRGAALRQASEAAIRDRSDPSAIFGRLKQRMYNATGLPQVGEAGARMFKELGKSYDNFIDDLVGRHVISLSQKGADDLAKAMAGGGSKDVKAMFDAAHKASGLQTGQGLSVTGAIANSEAMAFLRRGATDTGRTAISELNLASPQMGGIGNAEALNKGLNDPRFYGARAELRSLVGGISGFDDMNAARRKDELRSSIAKQIDVALTGGSGMAAALLEKGDIEGLQKMFGGKDKFNERIAEMSRNEQTAGAATLLRAGLNAQGKFGRADFLTGLIAAGQMGDKFVDFTKIASGDAGNVMTTEGRAKELRAADEMLGKVIDDPGVKELVKSSPSARKVLSDVASGNEKIRKALMSGDEGEAVSALAAQGIKLSQAEVNQLRSAVRMGDVKDNNGNSQMSSIFNALQKYDMVEKGKDFQVIADSFNAAAADIKNASETLTGDTKTAALKVSETLAGFTTGKNDINAVRGSIGALMQKAEAEKDPEKRAQILRAAGPLGHALSDTLAQGRGLSRMGKVGVSDIARQFGVAEADIADSLAGMGITASTKKKLSAAEIAKVEETVAGAKSARILAGGGKTETAQDKDQQVIETLKKIEKSIDLNTSVISVQAGILKGQDAEVVKGRVALHMKENSNATSNGASTGGS